MDLWTPCILCHLNSNTWAIWALCILCRVLSPHGCPLWRQSHVSDRIVKSFMNWRLYVVKRRSILHRVRVSRLFPVVPSVMRGGETAWGRYSQCICHVIYGFCCHFVHCCITVSDRGLSLCLSVCLYLDSDRALHSGHWPAHCTPSVCARKQWVFPYTKLTDWFL